MKANTLYLVLFLMAFFSQLDNVWAQKKAIDPSDYARWESLKSTKISENGSYVSYEVQPLKGDTYLYVYNTITNETDSIFRGKGAIFSKDEKWMIYRIETGYDTLRKLEIEKVNKKKWPKDSLGIYNLETKVIQKIPEIKTFEFDDVANVLIYLTETNDSLKIKKDETKELDLSVTKNKVKKVKVKKPKKSKKGEVVVVEKVEEPKKKTSEGKRMHIYSLTDSVVQVFHNVEAVVTFEKAPYFVYVEELDKERKVNVYDLKERKNDLLVESFSSVESVVKHPFLDQISFLAAKDTGEVKVFELFQYEPLTQTLNCVIDSTFAGLPKGKTVVNKKELYYSKSMNNVLFFYVDDIPKKVPKDSITDSEKVRLDIWTYDEPVLKTMQLASQKRDLKQADLYGLNLSNNQIYLLANDTLSLQYSHDENKEWVLAKNRNPYKLSEMWDYNSWQDAYKVNLMTGEKSLIRKKIGQVEELSRRGDKLVYFNDSKKQFYAIDLPTNSEICMTCSTPKREWDTDPNGMPIEASPVQTLGFNQAGTCFYLADRTDVFEYNFVTNKLKNLSDNKGVVEKKEFRFLPLSSDSSFVDLNRMALRAFDKKTKGNEIHLFIDSSFVRVYEAPAQIVFYNTSKKGNVQVMRKNTVSEYSNLWVANDNSNFIQISNANAHQSEYKWSTVELIKWKSYKGLELEGLVYKPDDFDATKSYPMIVYYYETYSESLHNYYGARPTASIVFPTEYASNDYIVFIPDIYYTPGFPARGAYDCIMSGTDAVLKQYPNIDKNRMGLQGQSWGGYQTAMLITMTDRFKAAMAGAPVSNMFSAFGGIRWGTGMSRMGQYEKGQSRIGKTIWEAPQLYTENSPLFHLPKVKTPLLIMANDKDGAVPWYQGIELFMGMRRLQKPAWLLNYNGDDHNLMQTANRYDLSLRMMQFFNYYLQNKPEPRWMKDGIPATLKDKEMRYELLED